MMASFMVDEALWTNFGASVKKATGSKTKKSEVLRSLMKAYVEAHPGV